MAPTKEFNHAQSSENLHLNMFADLIHTVTAQAATKHEVELRSINFKGTVRSLEVFQPLIAIQGERDSAFRMNFYNQLLGTLAKHCVADRPDRYEPR